jgi:hypothetical protein
MHASAETCATALRVRLVSIMSIESSGSAIPRVRAHIAAKLSIIMAPTTAAAVTTRSVLEGSAHVSLYLSGQVLQ